MYVQHQHVTSSEMAPKHPNIHHISHYSSKLLLLKDAEQTFRYRQSCSDHNLFLCQTPKPLY